MFQAIMSPPRGQHVCLYCRSTFGTPSRYMQHVKRPIAKITYRCHLCPAGSSSSSNITTPIPALADPPAAARTNSASILLSAPNMCALYVHMAKWHADRPTTEWTIVQANISLEGNAPASHELVDRRSDLIENLW